MNNTELLQKFQTIAENNNVFDVICELKNLQKDYKKSDFYKQTKMSIDTAYKLFIKTRGLNIYNKLNEWLDVEHLTIKLNNILDEIDEDKIQKLIQTITKTFNLDNLDVEKGELKNLLNQIKTLN